MEIAAPPIASFTKEHQKIYQEWFACADSEGDGRLTGGDAIKFFSMSNLSRAPPIEADFALSRTRSGDSSASNRHTLSKRAKKSPLAAGRSPIPPILSPAVAAAATSIQNETHAANLVRSPMITAGMALLATPERRFTRSMLVQRDPAAGSKTLVDEQATSLLEIPGDGSNMQTSVLKKEIDEDGAEMTLLETHARRFTRYLHKRPSIAGEGDPAAGLEDRSLMETNKLK